MNGKEIRGEIDVHGQQFDAAAVAAGIRNRTNRDGFRWSGFRWSGFRWSAADFSGCRWSATSWEGSTWD